MYKLIKNPFTELVNVVNKIEEGRILSIPFDPDNTDYANFKKDLANGAELLDAEGNVIDGIAYLKELV
jgi:hypothetical protein